MQKAILLWCENGKDKDGFVVENKKSVEVYAKEKSIKWAEAYEAMRAGVTISFILEIRAEDWEMSAHIVNGKKEYARKVQYKGCEYEIARAFKRPKTTVELTCG